MNEANLSVHLIPASKPTCLPIGRQKTTIPMLLLPFIKSEFYSTLKIFAGF